MRSLRKRVSSRARRESGATLVEYALILAVVVVGAIGGIRYLETQSSDEVAEQADCVSTRPPPPSCIRPIVATTTTVIAPTTTETTEAPTTTTTTEAPPPTEPPTTEPPPTTEAPPTTTPASSTTSTTAAQGFSGSAGWNYAYSSWGYGGWSARAEVQIRNPQGFNVRNAAVVVRWTITSPANGGTGTLQCTTDWDGNCTVRAPTGNSSLDWNIATIRLEVVTINGLTAPVGTATRNVNRP